MRRIGICLVLVLGLAFITLPAGGCGSGGGGGGGGLAGSPVFLDLPIKWLDEDNSGGFSVGDKLILCFDRAVASGANLPAADLVLAGAGGSLVGATWTNGPGAGKMTLNMLGVSTVTLGKVGGTTIQIAGGNTLTNNVAPVAVGATPAATPNTIMGNIVDSGQNIGGANLSIAGFDVDADGDMDVVAGRAGNNLVFINNALNSGTYAAGTAITNEVVAQTNALCWGRINQTDGLPDFVACNAAGVASLKYLNTLATPGVFQTDPAGAPPGNRSTMGPIGENATGCIIADFPGWDTTALPAPAGAGGDIFIAVGNPAGQNRIFFANHAGQVNNDNTLAMTHPAVNVGGAATDTRAVAGGDLNGGGVPDIVTADDMGAAPGAITVRIVTPGVPPTFVTAVIVGLPNPRSLLLCDLDNDTDLDMVVGYTGGLVGMQIYRNNAVNSGTFTLIGANNGGNVFSLGCTDVDGDGLRDIIQGRGNNGGLKVFLNCGALAFADSGVTIPGNFLGCQGTGMAATGLDAKGLGDIVTADSAANSKVVISGK